MSDMDELEDERHLADMLRGGGKKDTKEDESSVDGIEMAALSGDGRGVSSNGADYYDDSGSPGPRSMGGRIGSFQLSGVRPIVLHGPTVWRDSRYGIAFALHLVVVAITAFLTDGSGKGQSASLSAWIPGKKGGIWASLMMVATLLGCFAGVSFILLVFVVSSNRAKALQKALPVAVAMESLMAVLLLVYSPQHWFVSLLLGGVAVNDLRWFTRFRKRASFSGVLMDMVVEVFTSFPAVLMVSIGFLVFQSCFLLWWSTALVASLKGAGREQGSILIIVMLVSLAWTTQVFLRMVTVVASGCMSAWCNQQENSEPLGADTPFAFARKALTSSFGSVCKGALLAPLGHVTSIFFLCVRRVCRFPTCASDGCHSLSYRLNELAFVHVAAFSSSFRQASLDIHSLIENDVSGPGLAAILRDDVLLAAMQWVVVAVAIPITGALSVSAVEHTGESWAVFSLILFLEIHAAMSLAVELFKAAVSAVYVCFVRYPDAIANGYPLIYHRLLRLAEMSGYSMSRSGTPGGRLGSFGDGLDFNYDPVDT